MHIEVELKLAIQSSDVSTFQAIPFLQSTSQHEVQQLVTRYYDTPDFFLKCQGYALRLRVLNNIDILQTIKSTNQNFEGLCERKEWETKLQKLEPDYHVFPDLDIRQQLLNTQVSEQITCLFYTEFLRENWIITNTHSSIIVSLDQGKVKTHDGKSTDILEVELEILKGEKEDLFQLHQKLEQFVKLEHMTESKASKGYSLITA